MLQWGMMFRLPTRSFHPAHPAKDVGNPSSVSVNSMLSAADTCPDRLGVLLPIFLFTDHCPLDCPDSVGVTAHYCVKSFSCNTYKKHEGEGVIVN